MKDEFLRHAAGRDEHGGHGFNYCSGKETITAKSEVVVICWIESLDNEQRKNDLNKEEIKPETVGESRF